MQLDSVRALKISINESIIEPMSGSIAAKGAFGIPAQPIAGAGTAGPTMALGVARKAGRDYQLAVRLQTRGLENSPQLDSIRKRAKGEVDVQFIGRVVARATPWTRKNHRPLKIGLSVGHYRITAGTIGGFVRGLEPKDRQATMILSNNHVLANVNRAKQGDAILQPGPIDEGADPPDRVATLTRFVKLNKAGGNKVDAAVATLEPGIEHNPKALTGLGGPLAGVGPYFLDEGLAVAKVGRTTGATRGKVTAFELDNVYVNFEDPKLAPVLMRFDDQVEIEGEGEDPFSQGGDSGSLIVDADRKAVGLLFAGSEIGGSNGKGLTIANPIDAVLRALKVELLSS